MDSISDPNNKRSRYVIHVQNSITQHHNLQGSIDIELAIVLDCAGRVVVIIPPNVSSHLYFVSDYFFVYEGFITLLFIYLV